MEIANLYKKQEGKSMGAHAHRGAGAGFAFILVVFILLVIIGAAVVRPGGYY